MSSAISLRGYYNIRTFPESTSIEECDTVLVGEQHNKKEDLDMALTAIKAHKTSRNVLLLESCAAMQNCRETDVYNSKYKKHERFSDIADITALGWDTCLDVAERWSAFEHVFKLVNDSIISPISNGNFRLSIRNLLEFIANRNPSLFEHPKYALWVSVVIDLCKGIQPSIDRLAAVTDKIYAIETTLAYEMRQPVDRAISLEQKNVMVAELEGLRDEMESYNEELIAFLKEHFPIYNSAVESSFPSRTASMVRTLQMVHRDPEVDRCFLIAGYAHLDPKYQSQLTTEHSLIPEKAALYNLDPLFDYLKGSGRKIAVLLPKKADDLAEEVPKMDKIEADPSSSSIS